jgi:hypothetical protein
VPTWKGELLHAPAVGRPRALLAYRVKLQTLSATTGEKRQSA